MKFELELLRRLYVVQYITGFLFLVIVCRVGYLQIHLSTSLGKLSEKNFTRLNTITSPRGNITDCRGILLATNMPVKHVCWHGTGKRQLTPQQQRSIKKLSFVLNRDMSELQEKIAHSEKNHKDIVLEESLSFNQLSKIEELFSTHPNIHIISSFIRYYPFQTLACHILGYLGTVEVEKIGKMGLEKLYNKELHGQSGKEKAIITSTGKKLSVEQLERARAGNTIVTTLDAKIQSIAEKAFLPSLSGTILVMDPKTGAIRALVSRPNFDPALFLKPISHETWTALQQQRPFLNRALDACYPPASIFKLITIATALDKGIITPETTVKCRGHIEFGKRRYHCNQRFGHGELSIKDAMSQSCNILFYNLGQQLTINELAAYAKKFGLGDKTGIILPEQCGLVPTREWKIATHGEPWWVGETLSASIGQSYLLVTPLQIARMISAIFEENLVRPRILALEETQSTPLKIAPETLEFLRDCMRKVVTTGTGKRVSSVQDFTIFAKTGTAQTCALEQKKAGREGLEHAWFAGNFTYKNDPSLTMVILVEHVGATRTALSIAKRFLLTYRAMRQAQES